MKGCVENNVVRTVWFQFGQGGVHGDIVFPGEFPGCLEPAVGGDIMEVVVVVLEKVIRGSEFQQQVLGVVAE